jgi:hypothetical protein
VLIHPSDIRIVSLGIVSYIILLENSGLLFVSKKFSRLKANESKFFYRASVATFGV